MPPARLVASNLIKTEYIKPCFLHLGRSRAFDANESSSANELFRRDRGDWEGKKRKSKTDSVIHSLSKSFENSQSGSSSGNSSKFVEEFAEQFGNEAIDVVRIISFVLRAFLRVLDDEAAARLSSGVSGIRRGGSTAEVAKVCKLCEPSSPSATRHTGPSVCLGPTRTQE
ncbi:hypothetical protein K0M31_015004, partial [Melipona bicolor]